MTLFRHTFPTFVNSTRFASSFLPHLHRKSSRLSICPNLSKIWYTRLPSRCPSTWLTRMSSTASSTSSPDTSSTLLFKSGYRQGDRVLLFDGVCVICNRGVDFVLRYDVNNKFKLAALQSDVGLALLDKYGAPKDLSTVVLIDGDSAYTKSDAVLRVGQYLGWYFAMPAQLALFLIPKRIRDYMYSDLLAKNRYQLFGKKDECRLVDPKYKSKFLL